MDRASRALQGTGLFLLCLWALPTLAVGAGGMAAVLLTGSLPPEALLALPSGTELVPAELAAFRRLGLTAHAAMAEFALIALALAFGPVRRQAAWAWWLLLVLGGVTFATGFAGDHQRPAYVIQVISATLYGASLALMGAAVFWGQRTPR